MNSLDDELEFEYWLYEQAAEDAKEKTEDNVVKYVEEQEYSLYEDRFVYDNNCVIRKKKILKYKAEARVCDYFCRFIIDFWANQAKTSVTPKELYGKMIFRGQYTSWKGFFWSHLFQINLDYEEIHLKLAEWKICWITH